MSGSAKCKSAVVPQSIALDMRKEMIALPRSRTPCGLISSSAARGIQHCMHFAAVKVVKV